MSVIGNCTSDPAVNAMAYHSGKQASAEVRMAAQIKAQKVSMDMDAMAASVIEGSLEKMAPPEGVDVRV